MKKIMNTTLVAVAVAIACVGNVNARVVSKGTDAKVILHASKAVVAEPTKANGEKLKAVLDESDKSDDEREMIVLRAQEKDTVDRIALRKEEMKNLNYGWFGFGTDKETQEKHKRARNIRSNLEKDLKQIRVEIREIEVITGKAYSNAIKYAVGAASLVGIGIATAAVDKYYLEDAGKKLFMNKSRDAIARAERAGTAAKKFATEQLEKGRRTYRSMRYGAPVVEKTTPDYRPEL